MLMATGVAMWLVGHFLIVFGTNKKPDNIVEITPMAVLGVTLVALSKWFIGCSLIQWSLVNMP